MPSSDEGVRDLTRRFRVCIDSNPVGRYGAEETFDTIEKAEAAARVMVREKRRAIAIYDTLGRDWLTNPPATIVRMDAYDRVCTDVSPVRPLL